MSQARSAVVACAVMALVVPLLAPAAARAGPPVSAQAVGESWTFDFTGATQAFAVPAQVEALTAIVVGGPGGSSENDAGPPGNSGMTIATFDVTPGDTLTIWVGQRGIDGSAWGYGCGQNGGDGGAVAWDGGSSGAASAVTRGSTPATGCGARPGGDAVLAVAGGGGGGGGNAVLPPSPHHGGLSLGGAGGDGGNPAGTGHPGDGGGVPGGCGGCQSSPHGAIGSGGGFGGGAGAGGGGLRGGGSGFVSGQEGAGGGGGGSSHASPDARNVSFLPGAGGGDGWVTLVTGATTVYECTHERESTTVPAGAGAMHVVALGGGGGSRGVGKGGAGGPAGSVDAKVRVAPGDTIDTYVGCQGHAHGGWGYGTGGTHGEANDANAYDGGGGGGSSAVLVNGTPAVVAGGGGAGGGNGGQFASTDIGTGFPGGGGGAGGLAPTPGHHGQGPDGFGGCAGCKSGPSGHHGHATDLGSFGGGGGGSGAGWFSGGGGGGGHYGAFAGAGGGGGGGGGGMSTVSPSAYDWTFATSNVVSDGFALLTFLTDVPAAVTVHGGSKQTAGVGMPFAEPLQALVTNLLGDPVAGVPVTFNLPNPGAEPTGTFPGGQVSVTVNTGSNGIATSPPITANLVAGSWDALAAVPQVTRVALFGLTNASVATATAVGVEPDPATTTESITLSATVTATLPSAGTPVGDVGFRLDGTALGTVALDTNGVATLVVDRPQNPGVGNYTVTAEYQGTNEFRPSSGAHALAIVPTPTATQVTSSLNPSDAGEAVTFTATVTVPSGSLPPDGQTVSFGSDEGPLGDGVVVDGIATSPAIDTLSVGTHPVTAHFPGDAVYGGSSGTVVQVVDPDATATSIAGSPNPVEFGAAFELAALVTARPPAPGTPTGTVTFATDANELCAGTLTDAETACTPTMLPEPGAHTVLGTYSGDTEFDPSTGRMTLQVSQARTVTAVEGIPPERSVYGNPVSFRAHVERSTPGGGTPTGTIQFLVDGEPIGDPVVVGPDGATSEPILLAPGGHSVSAVYSGDARFSASTGATTYHMEPAPTTASLAASVEPSAFGEAVTFTTDVAASTPGVVPEGVVEFRVDGVVLGEPVVLVNGRASSTPTSTLAPGDHEVASSYRPANGWFLASHATIVHGVEEPTVTVLASSQEPSLVGDPVTVRARVGPAAPAGTLSFALDGQPVSHCQALALADSEAACTLTDLAAGTHVIGAAYSGATLIEPSAGTLVQRVDAAPPPPTPATASPSSRGGSGRLAFTGSGLLLALAGVLLLALGLVLRLAGGRRSARRA